MTLEIQLRTASSIPIEVEGVHPSELRGLDRTAIERIEIHHGNRQLALAELFDVSGDASDERIVWQGDCSGVHWIGAGMSSGEMIIEGDAGRHLGSELRGGKIRVERNAGDWVGAEMRGGDIHVGGNAGHLVGAAYRGSPRGMTGGTIRVGGDAGNEIGHSLRRGTIAVGGSVGDLAGFNMLAGSIVIFGNAGIRHGAGMRRGTIAILGPERPPLLPTFKFACRYQPLAMMMIARRLAAEGLAAAAQWIEASALTPPMVDLYRGDFLEGGRGEIWLTTGRD